MAEDRPPSPSDRRQGGFLSRVWRGIFGGREEDYEKRLEYLSKEESAVSARMRKRAAGSREATRNFVASSVIIEVAAVFYAIIMTRSVGLDWQLRAVKMIPMFLIPGLSIGIYSAFVSFNKMRDRNDRKTLENLRAERQAKIDELKERTNFYSTQQLIQRYDLDPAAKAAAATVLASKLSTDFGLKVYLTETTMTEEPSGRSNDVVLVASEGLRNRKQTSNMDLRVSSAPDLQPSEGAFEAMISDGQLASAPGNKFVEHYKGPATYSGGWFARLAAMLVGDDPTQCYALICGTCHMHNGLVRKVDLPYLTYYCPHCHVLNSNRQSEGSNPDPDINSCNPSSHGSGSTDTTPEVRDGDPSASQVEECDPSATQLGENIVPSVGEVVVSQANES